MLELELNINPKPTQSVRVGNGRRVYKANEHRKYLETLRFLIRSQLGRNDTQLFTGPVVLKVDYFFKPPKDLKAIEKEKIRLGVPCYKYTKPDLDNLSKPLLDALEQEKVYENDSRVCRINATKQYSNEPKISVIIENLNT